MIDGLRVFINYARADGAEYAKRIHDDIKSQGLSVWLDSRDIKPHKDFTAEIEKAIEISTVILVCITADVKRGDSFVRREIGYALGLNKPIIPLLFDSILPPVSIVNMTRIDFKNQNWDKALLQLLEVLKQPLIAGQNSLHEDIFHDYLRKLGQEIANYLDETIFSFIAQYTLPAHDAVDGKSQSLFASFYGRELSIKDATGVPNLFTKPFEHFSEAFNYYEGRLLLLGEPGGGKTTTLLAFARDAVAQRQEDPTYPLPIFARISDWSVTKVNVSTVHDWLGSMADDRLKDEIVRTILNGKALLLLDGLDELTDEWRDISTETIYKPRRDFIEKIPRNNQVVITSRLQDYQQHGTKIQLSGAVVLQELDDLQIENYLKNYPGLFKIIQNDNELREIVRNPLLLSLFTYAYKNDEEKVSNLDYSSESTIEILYNVFKTYILRRFEHEKRKPYAKLKYDIVTTYQVLGQIAISNIVNRSSVPNELSVDEVSRTFWCFVGWKYSYKGFQLILSSLRMRKWLFRFGIFNPRANEFVEQMHRLHLLMPVGIRGFRFAHLLLRDHFAFEPLRLALFSSRWNVRRDAAYALGKLKDKQAVNQLIILLNDKYSGVRFQAAFALGQIGDIRATEPLIKILEDSDSTVQSQAAFALGQIGDIRATEPLIAAMGKKMISIYSLLRLRHLANLEKLLLMISYMHWGVPIKISVKMLIPL